MILFYSQLPHAAYNMPITQNMDPGSMDPGSMDPHLDWAHGPVRGSKTIYKVHVSGPWTKRGIHGESMFVLTPCLWLSYIYVASDSRNKNSHHLKTTTSITCSRHLLDNIIDWDAYESSVQRGYIHYTSCQCLCNKKPCVKIVQQDLTLYIISCTKHHTV